MLVKGKIISIDLTSNTCQLHIPVFDNSNGGNATIIEAIFSNTPGSYCGYNVGDTVIAGFENEEFSKPIILSKLYIDYNLDKNNSCGNINCDSLAVTKNASLPIMTKLVSEGTSTELKHEGSGASYPSIQSIINAIETLKSQVNTLQNELHDIINK